METTEDNNIRNAVNKQIADELKWLTEREWHITDRPDVYDRIRELKEKIGK